MTSEIGKKLKETRENLNITIGEVALATKINPRIIRAIEEDSPNHMPPKTFLRGFIQTYATFLHLNVDEIMKQFHEDMGTTRPQGPITTGGHAITPHPANSGNGPGEIAQPVTKSERFSGVKLESQSVALRIVFTTIGIAVLIALIIFVKKKMELYESEEVIKDVPEVTAIENREPALPALPATGSTTSQTKTETSSATSTGMTTAVATGTTAATATRTSTATAVKTGTASNTQTATLSATSTATATATKSATETSTGTSSAVVPPGQKREILIEALGPVTVEATINGKVEKYSLTADDVRTIRSDKPIHLRISNGGAVNLTKNGKDLGVAGSLGQSLEAEY